MYKDRKIEIEEGEIKTTTGLHKPFYVQIQEYLADLILSGKLPPETKIQSEREISEDLGVSRMTVRRAVTELVNEALLIRKHGSGTYVAKPKITYESQELIDYMQAMQSHNINTSNQVLEFGEVVASRRLAERLEVEIGHPLYHVVILRFANCIPVILERSFISCSKCPNLEEWDLEKSSIIDLLGKIYKMKIERVVQTVEAIAASEEIAQQLRVNEGFPLMQLQRILYSAKEAKPILYSQDFLRGDYTRVRTELKL